jgi:hypothetical protein
MVRRVLSDLLVVAPLYVGFRWVAVQIHIPTVAAVAASLFVGMGIIQALNRRRGH